MLFLPPNVLLAEELPYNANFASSFIRACKRVAILWPTQLDLIAGFRNQGLPSKSIPCGSTFNPPTHGSVISSSLPVNGMPLRILTFQSQSFNLQQPRRLRMSYTKLTTTVPNFSLCRRRALFSLWLPRET